MSIIMCVLKCTSTPWLICIQATLVSILLNIHKVNGIVSIL